MARKLVLCLLFFGLIAGISNKLYSQLTIELKQQGGFFMHVNVDNYPRFSAFVRASDNSSFIELSREQVLIFEDNRSVAPISISGPDADSWQRVEWYTTLQSKTDISMGKIDYMHVFATVNNQSAAAVAEYRLPSVSIINVLDIGQNLLSELNMGVVLVGESVSKSIKIWPQSARTNNGKEIQLKVDSIVIGSPQFRYFDVDGPPFLMTSPFTHDADIIFRPGQYGYQRDKMSIYYDNGRKTVLPITGGHFSIEKNTQLNLIQPNGGEILTPCEVYEIKWRGNVKGLTTKVEYTTDFGVTWKEIGWFADSSYLWTVPGDVSDNIYMRVSQPLQQNNSRNLQKDAIPVTKIGFDSKGDYLLAANRSGMIYEWELTDYTLKESYSIGEVNFPGESVDSKGVIYFEDNQKFVAAYNRFFFFPDNNPDTLAFFNVGNPDPYMHVPIDVSVKQIYTDSKRQFIAVLPQFDNKVYLHSFQDGSLIRTINFEQPIATMNFSKENDEAVVVLFNNDIILLDLQGFTETKTISMPDIPQIVKVGISPNSKFIGVGCLLPRYDEFTGNRNQAHLIDIESERIVRTSRIASSNPVEIEFSPTSNIMLTGNEGQPQIAFWNLPDNDFSGSIQGNQGVLTDMKLSPTGNKVASTSFSDDNLTIKSFTYPEEDLSDGTFKIMRASITVDSVFIQPKYLGTDNDIIISRKFCNTGLVPIIIDNASFKFGRHFRLKTLIETDTVNPSECFDFEVVFHPLDTGAVVDTLTFYSCSGEFKMSFESYSNPRSISFYSNPFEFGEVCIAEQAQKDFLFAKNNDPVPLKINYVSIKESGSPFSIVNIPRDTVIGPGQSIDLTILFSPQTVGQKNSTILISHSDLSDYKAEGSLSGTGIGTEIQTSHSDLRFIPEILTRTIKITNITDNNISIVEADIYPFKNYKVITPLPLPIAAREEVEIEIEWNGTSGPADTLHILAEPCVRRTVVILGPYSAQSYLKIPTVEADPNGEATIKVEFQTGTEHPYDGVRFFESELTINPRLFLPQTVTSDFGTGTITKNDIVDDRRVIGIRVEGDFGSEGVVANINGIAGLAETDTSAIRILPGSLNWGTSVGTTWSDGMFRLINLCSDRRIIQPAVTMHSLSVSPNPTSGMFAAEFISTDEGTVNIDILNNLGIKVISMNNVKVQIGQNRIEISGNSLSPGAYSILIRNSAEFISQQIIVIK